MKRRTKVKDKSFILDKRKILKGIQGLFVVFWEEIILAITFKNIISTSAFIIKYKQVKKRKGKK